MYYMLCKNELFIIYHLYVVDKIEDRHDYNHYFTTKKTATLHLLNYSILHNWLS